jgi:hypothetical protein
MAASKTRACASGNCIITGLAAVEPDPRAGENDLLLDTTLRAATALAQLLQARHGVVTGSIEQTDDRRRLLCLW